MAGNTAMIIFGFAVVMVFLVLAAQYESWSLPLAVILVVPMCLLELASSASTWPSMDINIFTQIGFVVLVGLASKNAILIVEFAKQQREAGESRARGDAGGVPAAAAADRDDVVRVHPRRRAADAVARRRRRDAADAGHGRVQRHARRDAVRHLPDAGVLLRHRLARRIAAVSDSPACDASAADSLDRSDAAAAMPSAVATAGADAAPRQRPTRIAAQSASNGAPRTSTKPRIEPVSDRTGSRDLRTSTSEDCSCSRASSSTGRSSPRCCRSSSRWPAASPCSRCRSRSIPEITPPTVEVSADLSRRQRPGRGRHRGRADRAAGQRRRGHDVHVVAVHQRRHLHADGHVQARHRPEHGPGAGAEPRRRWPSRSCPTWSSAAASRSRRSRPAC